MESWKQELDRHLAPHGVVFSEKASVQSFKQEMRTRLHDVRLPLFLSVLLYDGAGSLIVRITSFFMLAGIYHVCAYKWNTQGTPFVIIFFTLMSLPGFWMWWYRLMPLEKRMKRMQALFEKHAGTF